MRHTTTATITRRTLAVAAVALLAACGGSDDAREGTDTAVMGGAVTGDTAAAGAGTMAPGMATTTGASLADASTSAQLDSVSTAAKGGLTKLAPAVAIPLIQSLEDKLDNSNDPALTDIAKDLEKLREELDDDTIDGKEVGNILERLGPKVTAVADKGGAASGTLRGIGTELTSAARMLKR